MRNFNNQMNDYRPDYRSYPSFARLPSAQSIEGVYAGLDELNNRLIRIETKLCAYFEHCGFDVADHMDKVKRQEASYGKY